MDKVVVVFLDSLIMNFGLIYVSSSLLKKKMFSKPYKFLSIYFSFVLYVTISYLLIDNFFRLILTLIFLTLVIYKLCDANFQKSISSSFISLVLLLFAEIIYAVIAVLIFGFNIEGLHSTVFGNLLSNIIIVLIFISLAKVKKVNYISKQFINYTFNSERKSFFLFIMILQLVITMILYYIYFDVKLEHALIMCLTLVFVYIIIGFKYMKERGSYIKLETEYNAMMDSLSEYEKLYSYQRMLNHEFKNDLMVIRGMTNKKNRKLLTYIDEIVDFKNNKEEKWLNTLKRLPEGGLLGILYYKLLSMEQEKINICFELGRNFKAKDYNKIGDKLKNRLCKLLGIYLDNAIQAVMILNDKNISIKIDQDCDFISFVITNNFEDTIDLSRIYEKGYSTNGQSRGYGLAIAKEIIEADDRIINNTQIIGTVFLQEIKIKM